jgi:cytochrome c biogenesis protein CcdA
MSTLIALPSVATVVAAAAVDSLNPCAIGVLILFISVFLAASKKVDRRRLLTLGSAYIGVIYTIYFTAGLGLTAVFSVIPNIIGQYVTLIAATAVIAFGLLEIKDFFWYGVGPSLSISPENAKRIEELMAKKKGFGLMVTLGAFVTAVELPCTGGPYLAITNLLSYNFNLQALLLLLLYNLIFVLPLIVILFGVGMGALSVQQVKKWKQSSRAYMRLGIGLLLVALGWFLILVSSGTLVLA